jgi:hypothetical protein
MLPFHCSDFPQKNYIEAEFQRNCEIKHCCAFQKPYDGKFRVI